MNAAQKEIGTVEGAQEEYDWYRDKFSPGVYEAVSKHKTKLAEQNAKIDAIYTDDRLTTPIKKRDEKNRLMKERDAMIDNALMEMGGRIGRAKGTPLEKHPALNDARVLQMFKDKELKKKKGRSVVDTRDKRIE